MPELPEVETIVRGLNEKLVGRTIVDVQIQKPLVVKSNQTLFVRHLKDKTIQNIVRHGKAIFWQAASGECIRVHLGMTGQLLFLPKNEPSDPYARVLFHLDKQSPYDLHYRDVRQFGRLEIVKEPRQLDWGPDAWLASEEELFLSLREKTGMIKHALLNQHVIAGLGNIYVDESLHQSGIHPKRKLENLNDAKLKALCQVFRAVLKRSIDLGGTSFRNYVDTKGERGGFKGLLNVYGKEGEPCPVCSTKIKRIVVASRGTHFCPVCQKR